jgi:hypothetical protein
MYAFSLKLASAAMIAAILAAVGSPASANSTITHGVITITGDVGKALTPQVVYTVPGKRFLDITDIVIVNYDNAACDLVIGNGPAYLTSELRTQANSSATFDFKTGLLFRPHASVVLTTDERLPGDGACTPTFTLIGTLTETAPTSP